MSGSEKTPRISTTPIACLIVGIALTMVAPQFDGFVKGMCQGAGVALMVLSVVLFSAHHKRAKYTSDSQMWLPSRDEEER